MTHLSLYYALRPLIPRQLQIAVRRWHVGRIRPRVRDRWPILESAGATPEGWTGWPKGKRFAVVLTHDVESPVGMAKVPALMALEERLGFRSAFFLIPEGSYTPSEAFRKELTDRGFEIGVHGLHHDGHLFRSKKVFDRRASRINDYLRDWGAVGFRAPMMIRNLDWIRDLDVEYDASTFETDPFEPQPRGAETIFPFMVAGDQNEKRGYVELPYTVAQDFSLFVLLREQGSELWKQKIDWIVERGGMVLLDTHPDYMAFNGRQPEREEYPVRFYQEVLEYISTRYAGQFWHALPRAVAEFCKQTTIPVRRAKPRHIGMLAYSFYDGDNRIRRYAETLALCGDVVDAISLRRPEQAKRGILRATQERESTNGFRQISHRFRVRLVRPIIVGCDLVRPRENGDHRITNHGLGFENIAQGRSDGGP